MGILPALETARNSLRSLGALFLPKARDTHSKAENDPLLPFAGVWK